MSVAEPFKHQQQSLTLERLLLRSLGLARSRGRRLGARRNSHLATISSIDFGLQISCIFLELAEAVLQGVVGGAVVRSHCAEIDLVEGYSAYSDYDGNDRRHTLTPVARILATTRCHVSALSQLVVPFAMSVGMLWNYWNILN